MNSVTWAKTGGTAVIDFGKMAVSGPAGIAVTAVGSSRVLGRMEMAETSTAQSPEQALNTPWLPDLPDLPRETFLAYLKKRGAFLADVIKADLKHTGSSRGAGNHRKTAIFPCRQNRNPIRSGSWQSGLTIQRAETLYDLVSEITGFPKETLTLDSRLLDDLNLDSIKSGDLIARYAQSFGLAGELDPAEWTNASLGEIVDLIAHRLRMPASP